MTAHVALLAIELDLPSCHTLKEKRSSLKALLAAIHHAFPCSAAEVDRLDDPRSAVIACAIVSNDSRHAQRVVQKIPRWIEHHRPDLSVVDAALDLR